MSRKGNMKKLFRTIEMLLLTLIIVAIYGCGVQAKMTGGNKEECQLEQALYDNAKSFSSELSYMMAATSKDYYVERVEELNAFGIFQKKNNSLLWYCTIPKDFEGGEDPFDSLVYTESEKHLPEAANNSLEIAKNLICEYVKSSSIIKPEDKDKICEVIMNVKVHYITIADDDPRKNGAVMITHGVEIYVNDNMPENMFTAHTFAHEMIHVISNITNSGTKYENSYYNACSISEAITELIAQAIILNSEYTEEFVNGISYEEDFEFALALLGRYDILKAYFYSDYYDVIFEDVNKDAFDLYYLAITSLNYEEKIANNNMYVIWQQIKK